METEAADRRLGKETEMDGTTPIKKAGDASRRWITSVALLGAGLMA